MVMKLHVAVRLDDETIARLDRLLVATTRKTLGVELSRSDVLRATVLAGLPILEREHGLAPISDPPPPVPDGRDRQHKTTKTTKRGIK